MKRFTVLGLSCIASLFAVGLSSALAQQGYEFKLQLTTDNARHDPDGIWSDGDLEIYRSNRSPRFVPKIYTARITTPAGEWLLTQTNGDCNMQGMCTAVLYLLKSGQSPKQLANPQVQQGGSATLSLNYKKITTTEIDQNGRAFVGSYDVEPFK